MAEPRVVLHIGLHKAATRFLQRAVFRRLDAERFVVNSEPLFQCLRQAVRHPGDEQRASAAAAAAADARRSAGERTLVISDPSISGDMYSSHADYGVNLALVHELFPDATVLFFVRRQSDWLQSAYRQHLVKGRGIPIETFLNYYDGEFQPRIARLVNGARNVEALTLRFLEIYTAYAQAFGAGNVYLFRQEDLRQRTEEVYERLAEALGLSGLPSMPSRVSANRAFSALAIDLFYPGVHRRPRRPGPDDAGGETSPALRRMGKPWRKLRTALIRHVFDRLLYRDRDLLARDRIRAKLDAHYQGEHEVLERIADAILRNGPGEMALALASDAGTGEVLSNEAHFNAVPRASDPGRSRQ